ncbi:hypothetical protein A3Q34_12685 [Colwellia sp. PAMC 20917]|uniref:Lcl C-terminal domain-containing protein n=1 Tax=Colwellia sp. PAMC 20917 TaxID=1816218 RepID=UPI000878B742|nr:DUF1566 domain-containing protein [Colwellia sp. PAMC 20917]AOW77632.1 hypothetical protein A3Q34_12685 [Colwellia sp. PAMC 20917]
MKIGIIDKYRTFISASFLVSLAACGGGSGSDSKDTTPVPIANVAPIVSAGDDASVNETEIFTFSSSASDSDGTINNVLWEQTAGESIVISNADSLTAAFTAIEVVEDTTLTFRLTVTDDDGEQSSDVVNVLIMNVNQLPTVAAIDDFEVFEQVAAELSAVAEDIDGTIATYKWEQTAGKEVSLTNAEQPTATFVSGDFTAIETLSFSVTVTDNHGGSATDTMNVTVNPNFPPVAVIGIEGGDKVISQFITSGDTVTLVGMNSYDNELNNLTYQWQQIDDTGVELVITNNNAADTSFVANTLTSAETVTIQLSVTDELGLSDTEQVRIAITPVIHEKMNDTGLTFCADYAYDGSGNHSNTENCADVVDVDADPIPDGQDADYGRDKVAADDSDGSKGFSFIKLDENGEPLPQNATAWSCVLDNVTGLIWEVKDESGSTGIRDANSRYTWYNSTGINDGGSAGTEDGGSCTDTGNCDIEKYGSSVNAVKLCGITTWRVPTHQELNTLVDFSRQLPSVDTNYFHHTKSGLYWSSTPYNNSNNAWGVNFSEGLSSSAGSSKNNSGYVRLTATKG